VEDLLPALGSGRLELGGEVFFGNAEVLLSCGPVDEELLIAKDSAADGID
jgi:hypothetical protein